LAVKRTTKQDAENVASGDVLKGHGFSRAVQVFNFVIPSALQPARNSAFRFFQRPKSGGCGWKVAAAGSDH
jgi:hypothetical protein